MTGEVIMGFIAIGLVILALLSVRIATQYERAVIFRLGRYSRTAGPGLYMLLPLIEWATSVDLRVNTSAVEEQDQIAHQIETQIDKVTAPWGVKVERVQMRNVEIPESMQRAMAQEAEALREKRARQIKAEAELDAAKLLRLAAETIMQSPAGLELRRMQMITEVGAEQNTMTIVMMPSEFVSMARALGDDARKEPSSG
jgi:regulator of protease activity HflC (stomatin/prohibitin superfamily)